MAIARVGSYALLGLSAEPVTVEVAVNQGVPGLSVVGLPDKAVGESRDRVRSALRQIGISIPAGRVTVNLAPADLKKEGPAFDLPIALGILAAGGYLPEEALKNRRFTGELGLGGEIRPVRGLFVFARRAAAEGEELIVPAERLCELAHLNGQFGGAETLEEMLKMLDGREEFRRPKAVDAVGVVDEGSPFADITGQTEAKTALIIAAAGGHHIRMVGSPGTGKTLLARTLVKLLPSPSSEETGELLAINSLLDPGMSESPGVGRPFRSPHHTSSQVALIGGGSPLRPGEITLAHRGILFLDELPEFPRSVLEVLRQPLEEGIVHIARAERRVSWPAAFQLVAAHNPCPCGYFGDPERECTCPAGARERYLSRLSGPLLDRIDLSVTLYRLPSQTLIDGGLDTGKDPRPQVFTARERQLKRQGKLNAALLPPELRALRIDPEAKAILIQAGERFKLSGRALHRLLRVAQTVADLAGAEAIQKAHILRALSFRGQGTTY